MSEARALFMAGRVAFDEGRYEAALKHFEASYEQSQRPALLYNIAQCYDRMRRDEEALTAFERYLAVETDPEMRASVQARMAALRAAIAARKPAPVTEAPVLQPEPPTLAVQQTPSLAVSEAPESAAPHQERAWWRSPPVLTMTGGVLVAVAGGVLMAVGHGHGDDVEHAKVGSSYRGLQSDLDKAERQWVTGQVLLGVGAAALAGSVIWLVRDRLERRPMMQVSVTPTSLRLDGRF